MNRQFLTIVSVEPGTRQFDLYAEAHVVLEYLWKQKAMEIRFSGWLRKDLRADRTKPLESLPTVFYLKFDDSDEVEIRLDRFRLDKGWRTRVPLEKQPSKIQTYPTRIWDETERVMVYIKTPEPMAYFYWDKKTGSIKVISAEWMPELAEENKPATIPLSEAGKFFGEVSLSDYQVVFRDGKHVVKERPKYNYIQHRKSDGLFGIYYSPWEKTMEIRYYRENPETVVYWISKAGDPTLLVEKIEIEKGFEGTNTYKLNTSIKDLAVYKQEEDGFTTIPLSLLRGTDIAQLSIGSNALNPELVAKWNVNDKSLEFVLNRAGVVEEGFGHLSVYITKEGDPYYLIQSHLLDLRHMAEGYSTTVKVRTDQDRISVFTRQIFESSALIYV